MALKQFFLELASLFSRTINVLTGGRADVTFSARSYVQGLWSRHVIDALFLYTTGQPDHCMNAWILELDRSKDNLKASGFSVLP